MVGKEKIVIILDEEDDASNPNAAGKNNSSYTRDGVLTFLVSITNWLPTSHQQLQDKDISIPTKFTSFGSQTQLGYIRAVSDEIQRRNSNANITG